MAPENKSKCQRSAGGSVDVRQGPAADFRQGAGGEKPFAAGGRNGFRNNRLGADNPDGIAPGARLRRMQSNLGRGGGFLGKPLDFSSLNLSDEQKQRIKQMRQENGAKTKEIRHSLIAKRSELKDMMFDPSATDDQIRAKRRELRHFQDRIEELQINDFSQSAPC